MVRKNRQNAEKTDKNAEKTDKKSTAKNDIKWSFHQTKIHFIHVLSSFYANLSTVQHCAHDFFLSNNN